MDKASTKSPKTTKINNVFSLESVLLLECIARVFEVHTLYAPGGIDFHSALERGSPMNLEFKGLVRGGITAVFKQRQRAPSTAQLANLTGFLR